MVILALCVYQISRTNLLCAIISSCVLIYFCEFSCPLRLFYTVRLLDTLEYILTNGSIPNSNRLDGLYFIFIHFIIFKCTNWSIAHWLQCNHNLFIDFLFIDYVVPSLLGNQNFWVVKGPKRSFTFADIPHRPWCYVLRYFDKRQAFYTTNLNFFTGLMTSITNGYLRKSRV